MIFLELLYTYELKSTLKIIDVVNVTGQPTVKRKRKNIDHGRDFNDYSLIPITYTCRVLVLPCRFYRIVFSVFQLTVLTYRAVHHGSAPHTIATPERYHLCRHFYIVPTSCWRFLHRLAPASSVSAYYRNISVVIISAALL